MKTTIFLITVALITTAASPVSTVPQNASQHLAEQIIDALRNSSPDDYAALFPTIAEFHAIMDKNSSVYGEYLTAAKEEFALRYENELLPKLKNSFVAILEQGTENGIEWSQVSLERVECIPSAKDLKPMPFSIVFSADGKEYKMTINRAFIIHDEWKVSSEISLIQ
jgi:hypothetical protein